ncbi:hypothetical protein PPTG_22348 [Phytophthora nicotianae INRA-310]|uniref:Transcription activator GCR1-like domain-containing protein n=1 Tax=Phytophthora nicotianae (strain INRA-310) TaxID=761204 RepID=W2QKG7_PHYN3|nr:hypothetical protein PPTG_22348 [Phytophthora nicotianae INRA-310]ETN13391.1 hypothetical protein PPTG_22348 [Phytophthora nicotianae INRA-310]
MAGPLCEHSKSAYNESLPSTYNVSRSLKTVNRAWSRGVYGGPAVRALEERYGSSWRNSPAENRFYFRRKRIIDKVIVVPRIQQISSESRNFRETSSRMPPYAKCTE